MKYAILFLLLTGCATTSTADLISATTAKMQPLIDTTINVCRTARAEIERYGGDSSEVVAACEKAAAYMRAIRAAQDAACALDPRCE